MPTATAKKFKDAYFTSLDDAVWCVEKLSELINLKDKIALEPAAGSGVFLRASKKSGLVWVTNELYPEFAQGYEADFSLDFGKADLSELGRFDVVLTNPPFGGSNMLARKFVKRSLEISDTVAMLLPRGCRRGTTIDKDIPDDVEIILDEDLPNGTFDLPDGTTREVGCVFMVFQRKKGYSRGLLCEYEPEGYGVQKVCVAKKGRKDFTGWCPGWATHGLCVWGSAGSFFDCTRKDPFAEQLLFRFTDEQAEVVKKIDWDAAQERSRTSVPRLVDPEVFTVINRALREAGVVVDESLSSYKPKAIVL